jgi:site-specific DNA-methyltransferase (adenine-specific)
LIFADPPYSIGKAEWDMFYSHEEYLLWCEKWIGECSRILTDKGTCYICGFSEILSDVKYRTQHFFNGCRWIVWHYRNKANLGMDWGRSHESLLHFRKGRTTVLNVDDIRIPYSAHTLKYPVHPQAGSSAYGKGRSNSSAVQWRPNEKGAKPKDVFDIPTTCNGMGEKTPHPTQKPEELVRKLVLASSREGDLVVDPFSGSGTTAVVAQQLHRRWLACDRNKEYNQWAIQRLEHVPDHPIQYWIEFDREVSKRRESIR